MLDPSLLVLDARRSADVNPNPYDSSSNKLAESYDVVLARPRPSILDRVSVDEGSLPLVNSEGSGKDQEWCVVFSITRVLDYRILVLWLPCSAPRTDESPTPSTLHQGVTTTKR